MPNYYTPGSYFPPTYQSPISYTAYNPPVMPMMQPQSYSQGSNCAMAWVDGEIEARGRQMPQGVTQYAMWDTNKQVIYLKSLNQMGMPNPMQIIHYTMEETQSALPEGNTSSASAPDMSQYVTKQDFEQLREEIKNMSRQNNQNGSNNSMNRGGNK